MGKVILVLLLIGVVAFFVLQKAKTPATEEELKVKAVAERFLAVQGKIMGSGGGTGPVDLDTTEGFINQMKRIRVEIADLRRTLTEDKARQAAEDLRYKIEEFCKKNDID